TNEITTPSRRRMRRRHVIIFWSTAIASAILIGGIIYLIYFSSIIKVKQFSIQGNRVAGSEDLQQLLIKKLDTRGWFRRAFGSSNILYWVGAGEVRDSGIPAASAIVVHVNILSRAVSVEIKEREFVGIWCAKTCVGFDSDGIAYFLAPDVEGSLLLKVLDENENELTLGNPVFPDATALKNIFLSIAIIKEDGIPIDKVIIRDMTLREWELQSTKGTVFKFSLDFVPEKLKSVLNNLKERTKPEDLSYVDLRVQNRVYFK
ncbi:MAG: hypothetical protein AAB920_03800, partial [Patescibacteria group bacterium]